MVFQPGNPGPPKRKSEPRGTSHFAPKPGPVEPQQITLATELMIAPSSPPAVSVSRSVTRSRADTSSGSDHRDYARTKAMESFDEAFDCVMRIIRDETASAQNKLRAAQLVIELSLGTDESETETQTFTSHLDALQGLAMKPAAKQITKRPPETGGSF